MRTKASNRILQIRTKSHLYKCFLEKISISISIIIMQKNNVTTSKRWKRYSVNVVNKRILLNVNTYFGIDEIDIPDFSCKIFPICSLIAFSF